MAEHVCSCGGGCVKPQGGIRTTFRTLEHEYLCEKCRVFWLKIVSEDRVYDFERKKWVKLKRTKFEERL